MRIPTSPEWIPGRIVKNEKDGKYSVECSVDGTDDGEMVIEPGVLARLLMTRGRGACRRAAARQSLLEAKKRKAQIGTVDKKSNQTSKEAIALKPAQPPSPRPSARNIRSEIQKPVPSDEGFADADDEAGASYVIGDRVQGRYRGGSRWIPGVITNVIKNHNL